MNKGVRAEIKHELRNKNKGFRTKNSGSCVGEANFDYIIFVFCVKNG